jgi:glycosyltransferase involved in cell wall biosynthesis
MAGYFGTFYPDAANDALVALLRRFSGSTGRKVVCFLAGRQNAEARRRWERLASSSDDLLCWFFLGELGEAEVSRYLHALDFGIAATPWALVGKSGSVAAMREHGLPVLVPRNDWTPREKIDDYGLAGVLPAWCGELNTQSLLKSKDCPSSPGKEGVAGRFLRDLSQSSTPAS